MDQFSRTRLLLGGDGMARLEAARVAVFGVGGVGGYAVEALIRSGVGAIDVFDNDAVSLTNINCQIIAMQSTVGKPKVDVIKERAADINPEAVIITHNCFFMPENSAKYDFSVYSYIIDAVDTVTAKLEIISRAKAAGVPVISCMGTGNKLDAARLTVADIYETSVCPLAKVMRHELRRRGITELKVVYSTEPPLAPDGDYGEEAASGRRSIPGSTAFVPAVAGLIAAGEAVREIAKKI